MKFLTSILDKYLNQSLSFEQYNDIFLKLGYEVEEAYPLLKAKDFVVAKTKTCVAHPNANALSHCVIEHGGHDLDVICGGTNVRSNQWVIYAPVGAKVGDITLAQKDLRGINSNGMILSISEIINIDPNAIEKSSRGEILEIVNRLQTEISVEEFLEINNLSGYVFDLSILSDRQYANNHIMLAKEIAAFLNIEFVSNLPSLESSQPAGVNASNISFADETEGISIQNSRINFIKNIKTPTYIRSALYVNKIPVTNTMEDVLNYVFLLSGVSVYLTEPVKNISLLKNMLILDDKRIDTLVSSNCLVNWENNQEQEFDLIAFASKYHINPLLVKNLNQIHGLNNARGTSHILIKNALKLVIKMLLRHGYIDSFSKIEGVEKIPERKKIKTSLSYIKKVIGFEFDAHRVFKILDNLNFEIDPIEDDEDQLIFTVPLYRKDVVGVQEIIEEIIRGIGTDKFKDDATLLQATNTPPINIIDQNLQDFKNLLVKQAMFEVKNYQLLEEEQNELYNVFALENEYLLKPEFSFKRNAYRKSLLNGMLETYRFNYRQNESQPRSLPLFEMGNVFVPSDDAIVEGHRIHAAIMIDDLYPSEILEDESIETTLVLKTLLENALEQLYQIDPQTLVFEALTQEQMLFNPFNSASVLYQGEIIAKLGELHPQILRTNKFIRLDKVKRRLYYLELNLSPLIANLQTK